MNKKKNPLLIISTIVFLFTNLHLIFLATFFFPLLSGVIINIWNAFVLKFYNLIAFRLILFFDYFYPNIYYFDLIFFKVSIIIFLILFFLYVSISIILLFSDWHLFFWVSFVGKNKNRNIKKQRKLSAILNEISWFSLKLVVNTFSHSSFLLFLSKKFKENMSWISLKKSIAPWHHKIRLADNTYIACIVSSTIVVLNINITRCVLDVYVKSPILGFTFRIIAILNDHSVVAQLVTNDLFIPQSTLSTPLNRFQAGNKEQNWFFFEALDLKFFFGLSAEWNILSVQDKIRKAETVFHSKKKCVTVEYNYIYKEFMLWLRQKRKNKKWDKKFHDSIYYFFFEFLVEIVVKFKIVLNLDYNDILDVLNMDLFFKVIFSVFDNCLLHKRTFTSKLISYLQAKISDYLKEMFVLQIPLFRGWSELTSDEKAIVHNWVKSIITNFSNNISRKSCLILSFIVKNFFESAGYIFVQKQKGNQWYFCSIFNYRINWKTLLLNCSLLPSLVPLVEWNNKGERLNANKENEVLIKTKPSITTKCVFSSSLLDVVRSGEKGLWTINLLFLGLLQKTDNLPHIEALKLGLPFPVRSTLIHFEAKVKETNKDILPERLRKSLKANNIHASNITDENLLPYGLTVEKYKLHLIACKYFSLLKLMLVKRKEYELEIYFSLAFKDYHFYYSTFLDFRLRSFNTNRFLSNSGGGIYRNLISAAKMRKLTIYDLIFMLRCYYSCDLFLKEKLESFLISSASHKSKNFSAALYQFYLANKRNHVKRSSDYLINVHFDLEIVHAFTNKLSNFLFSLDCKSSVINIVSMLLSDSDFGLKSGLFLGKGGVVPDIYVLILNRVGGFISDRFNRRGLDLSRSDLDHLVSYLNRGIMKKLIVAFFNGSHPYGRFGQILNFFKSQDYFLQDSFIIVLKYLSWNFDKFIYDLFPQFKNAMRDIKKISIDILSKDQGVSLKSLDGSTVNYTYRHKSVTSRTSLHVDGKKENVYVNKDWHDDKDMHLKGHVQKKNIDKRTMNRVFFSHAIGWLESHIIRDYISLRNEVQLQAKKKTISFLTCFDSLRISFNEYRYFFQIMDVVYRRLQKTNLLQKFLIDNDFDSKNIQIMNKNEKYKLEKIKTKRFWR